MILSSWLEIAVRASLLLALSLAVLPALRGVSASLRRCVLLLGLGAALALPLLAFAFPGRQRHARLQHGHAARRRRVRLARRG
jgi:hypothetical protein